MKKKLHSEKLQDLYWSLNAGGWLTEIQCERDYKRNVPEKLKIHTKFQFETVKEKGNLGVQGLDQILKTM